MNRFLNDGVSIEGSSQVGRAAALLRGASVDKATLSSLATRLSSSSMFTNLVLTSITKGSVASGVVLANVFSEVYSRLENLFATSNAVSLLMSNTAEILSQEIKKLEEELSSLEKNVNNYGFLLADGNAYDSVFFESFSDELNSENVDLTASRLSDRSGLDFSQEEIAIVEKTEGVLTIPKALNREYPIRASVFASNCAAFLTNPISTNSVSNTTDYLNPNGWRPVVESPVIIDGSLYLFKNLYGGGQIYTGAQFVLQYEMDDENPIDTILIDPLSNYSFDLVQVIGFASDNDTVGEPLMRGPVKIEKTFNLLFPKKSFKKFHLYINQKAYTREASYKSNTEATAEMRTAMFQEIKSGLYDNTYEISTEYPVVDLTSYWQNVLQNLGGSLSRQDFEVLQQGLPSYWTYESGLMQKQSSTFEDEDGAFAGREKTVNGLDINHSYIQSLIGRFFGYQDGSIGSFFKTIVSNYYYPNSPTTASTLDSSQSQVRLAPFPRIGEEETAETLPIEESDSYTIGVPDVSSWTSNVNWDFWFGGIVKDVLDREGSQLIPEDLVWSEKDGKWISRQELDFGLGREIYPQPYYGDNKEADWYLTQSDSAVTSRIDTPYEPSAGGGTQYTIPSISYDEIMMTRNNSYFYKYTFGLRSVKAKLSNYRQRAVYVSKPIGTLGDVSEVKLKVSTINFIDQNTSNSLTSAEYSVSNSADISSESSWTPILPIENQSVLGERIFPDSSGLARFRFNANSDGIVLYKNGIRYSQSDVSSFYVKRDNTNTIYGLKIPLQKYTSSDVLTCDYVPIDGNSVISFDNFSNQINSYLSYYGDTAPGQPFSGTGQMQYELNHIPYIDYSQVNSSSYSSDIGLYPYVPIRVLFEDGTTASNLTNYKNSKMLVLLDKDSESYQFLQSGNVLIFNRPVNSNFRVFYNYLPNTFRVRIIMRSNYFESVSPKVDFYQVKAKTRKPDSQRY